MAITKIHPIKSTLKKAIDYIVDPAKTDDKLLVSSFGCAVETADLEFEKTRLLAMQKGNNLAHHLIQAFEPGEVSYAQAHEIGRQLADEILGGKYEYVIATHINKEHCHNHIIFCAVDFAEHKKYISNRKSYAQIRRVSDRLCRENGLSVVIPKKGNKGKSYAEYQAEKIHKKINSIDTTADKMAYVMPVHIQKAAEQLSIPTSQYRQQLRDISLTAIRANNQDERVREFFEKAKNLYIKKTKKHFHIEINSILSEGTSLGTLILFKDITQHIEDMQKIKDAQETLMESERLSSLGQLIGGIAHNLKTPIMSISGAAEGLTDLVKEYDSSIDDPEVNSQDHHDIAKDMFSWIEKIKEYTEYMSDIITAVKGQAVTLSETENVSFDLDELVKRVNILMKHELKSAVVYLSLIHI